MFLCAIFMKILHCAHFKNDTFEETHFVPSIIGDDSFDLALRKQVNGANVKEQPKHAYTSNFL